MNPYTVQPLYDQHNPFTVKGSWILLKQARVVALFLDETQARDAASALNAVENRTFQTTPGQEKAL